MSKGIAKKKQSPEGGNGHGVKPLFEVGEVKVEDVVGFVKIAGRDYKVKRPQFRDWANVAQFAKDAKDEDPAKQLAAMTGYFAVTIPNLEKEVLQALPIGVAGELMQRVVKAVDEHVAAEEAATVESPFSGKPSPSPGSQGAPSPK